MRRDSGLRIALLTYRGNPHSGGQGVYVRYLSKALTELGHSVEVFSGQPYPELDPGVLLTPLSSLDLYRADDPFRTPKRSEFRDRIDVLEYALMCTAAFPEPLTFSLRAAREVGARLDEFDIVHDNQCLGRGLLQLGKKIPVVATVHHPCSIDRKLEVAHAGDAKRRMSLRRWYSFTKMQARVARRLPRLLSVSESAKDDVVREFGVDADNVDVIHNGVDTELFRPLPEIEPIPGRIVTTASADVPLKGLVHLIEALAKVRTERDAELVVIGRAAASGPAARAIDRFGLSDVVRFESEIGRLRMVELFAQAEVAVVPSLYEGFSLPAIEAMSCGVPLVTTSGGALPEVVGPNDEAALVVAPGDAGALAGAILRLLEEPKTRTRLSLAGRDRVERRFTWTRTAEATVAVYRAVLATC